MLFTPGAISFLLVTKMKATIFALIALLLFLQYKLWFSGDSVFTALQLQQQIGVQQTHNQELQARNRALAMEIADLKQESEAIEERARIDLGMVKEDEIFYRVIEDKE